MRTIFDIGFHNGDDTAHYLQRGFKVIAVEANPTLAAEGRTRFAEAIASGQLELLSVGIAKEPGQLDFYVNESNSEWSSFVPAFGQRGGRFSVLNVPTTTMAELLRRFGTPYYAKIDVEGNDWHCLNDIPVDDPPQYVSVEAHRLEYLAVLYGRGYRQFKIVNQTTHIGFPPGSSGPVSDTIEDWECLETVAYDWLHMDLGKPERSSLRDGWYDFHAKLGGPALVEGFAKPPIRFRALRRALRRQSNLLGMQRRRASRVWHRLLQEGRIFPPRS
jgi:FkbM family methyltransferase